MSIQHAQPCEVIDVRPLGALLSTVKTSMLVKTDRFEIIRIIMQAGKELAEHRAPGAIIVECLEGRIEFTIPEKTAEMSAGQLIYLPAAEPHAVRCIENASFLVTILFDRNEKPPAQRDQG